MSKSGLARGATLVAAVLIVIAGAARAEEPRRIPRPKGPVEVGAPVIPTISPAARDLPDETLEPELYRLEMGPVEYERANRHTYDLKAGVDPLLDLDGLRAPRLPDGIGAPTHNYEGYQYGRSPTDATLDVGPHHVVQVTNGGSKSLVHVMDKETGAVLKTFSMNSLTTALPCRQGLCDPIVLYDRAADRWVISELPRTLNYTCVYVSTSPDPTGTWYAYAINNGDDVVADYPKIGVWPQTGGGSYLLGINGGPDGFGGIAALDRAKMLAGQPAAFQRFTFPATPAGRELMLPATMQGPTPPPDGEPAIFLSHQDDEYFYYADTPETDYIEVGTLQVDWQTPANSTATLLPRVPISEFLWPCLINWECMHQAGTFQKLYNVDSIFVPIQYRNFGDHQTLVSTFDVDIDGTDHVGIRWFELRKTATSSWSLFQEGTIGGETYIHRAIGSIAMDGSGNIAIGYTRTGRAVPYYPSIYYRGRLATDPLGTMPHGEFSMWDATESQSSGPRWGDYSGIAVDPIDDCTFWYTTTYGGYGSTRVGAFKFDECGCLAVPPSPVVAVEPPTDNRIDVIWDDSPTASIVSYRVYRATTAGGTYVQIADVADSSPAISDGPSYVYHDDSVSGGTRYYYVVKSNDGDKCTSGSSNEADALATGACTLAPVFAGVGTVANPGASTCTLNLAWTAATAACSGSVSYNVYRSTASDFIPGPENRIATALSELSFTDAVGIAGGTNYFYIVRAVGDNGAEDVNVVRRHDTPAGPLIPLDWTETFEGSQSGGGFDLAGWTTHIGYGTSGWIWSANESYDGTHSWHAPGEIRYSDKALVSPPFVVVASTLLNFRHMYRFQGTNVQCFDGGTLEYTIDAGTNWTVVPQADFVQGAYTGTVTVGLGNPIAGSLAWCSDALGVWGRPTLKLGDDLDMRDRTVQLRWHEGNDIQIDSFGWYVDTVNLLNARIGSACSVGVCGPGSPGPGAVAGLGFATSTDLSWDPVVGATGYDVVRGTLSTLKVAGDFTIATDACPAHDLEATSFSDAHVPATDDGDWFLVRGLTTCGNGTYDDGSASQAAARDAAIAASAGTCP